MVSVGRFRSIVRRGTPCPDHPDTTPHPPPDLRAHPPTTGPTAKDPVISTHGHPHHLDDPDLDPDLDPALDPTHRAQLADVHAFSAELLAAADRGRDLRAVTAHLDPDPTRYFFVDEGDGRIPEFLDEGRTLLAEAPPLPGHVRHATDRIGGQGAGSRPSVAAAADGRRLATWIDWAPGIGERIVATLVDADHATLRPPEPLCEVPGDAFRPRALFDASGRAWVVYARSEAGPATAVAVYARRLERDGWTGEERISTTAHPSFNQEAVAHADGSVECVWQGRDDGRFGVFTRRWRDGAWGPATRLDHDADASVWDPTLTPLPDGGTTYAWCAYQSGAYGLVVATRTADADAPGPLRRLTTGSDYALHPSLTTAADGQVWCAFDRMTIHGHGGSGPTALQPAERVGNPAPLQHQQPGRYVPPELTPNIGARVEVVRVTDDGVAQDPIPLAQGVEVSPCGLPQVAATPGGGVVVCYRILRRLPLLHYFWEIAVQHIGPDGTGPVHTLADSDGGMEEPSVAWTDTGAVVAATTDDRREHALSWTDGFGGQRRARLAEHVGEIAWNGLHGVGEIVLGEVGDVGPARRGERRETLRSDVREEARAWVGRPQERYRTRVGDRELTLYWGDLHRHSLISRCTASDDPGLEDFYRYAWDVYDYDFWAVTDHAENSTAHQWWHLQKVADLFHVPDRFVPLYGFEWTSDLGHQNVIYGDVARGAPIFSATDEATDDPAKLWAAMDRYPGFPAITIPHHPGAAMINYDWSFGDPHRMRLVEVFQSCRGNYEDDGAFRQYEDATLTGTFTVDGLRRGHRFGLVASSDHGYGAAYVGAFAGSLDRGEVFEALYDRRTIAATARGIVLDVRVGGTFLGGELAHDGPVEVSAFARGYRELARIDIVRNGELAHALTPELDLPEGWIAVPVRVEWGRSGRPRDWSGSLTVHGGEVLQTPYYSREICAVDTDSVRWEATTHSFGGGGLYGPTRGGVELTVLGPPDSDVEVVTASGGVAAPLAALRAGPVAASGGGAPDDGSVLRLQPGTGGLVGLGDRERTLRWTDPVGGPAWYYVRVHLVDGEMAWSSPVWVDPVTAG